MTVDRSKAIYLMQIYCSGSYNRFARELGVDPSHLYRFLTSGVGGGKKIVGAVIKFCYAKGLNFEDFVNI